MFLVLGKSIETQGKKDKNEPHSFWLNGSYPHDFPDMLTDTNIFIYFCQGLTRETEVLGVI